MVTRWFPLFALLLLPCALAPLAHAQTGAFNPTHYWTYHLMEPVQAPPTTVLVRDQFWQQQFPVQVMRLERLLNWVHKNNSAVPDTFLHYTWWDVQPKPPVMKDVLVTNQFGSHPVRVVNLEFLLAPAHKNYPSPQPPYADHYLCYRAFGFPPPQQPYDLRDEWRVDIQHPGPLEYLCAPCEKLHGGLFFPILDPITHLAVYPIQPDSDHFLPFISDQFWQGPNHAVQFPLEYLFVPSEKTHPPTDTKKSTWGTLKSLYR
jgi:hypothetical protein